MQIISLNRASRNFVRVAATRLKLKREDLRMTQRRSTQNNDAQGVHREDAYERFVKSSQTSHESSARATVLSDDAGLRRLRENINELETLHSRLEFLMDEIQGLIRRT